MCKVYSILLFTLCKTNKTSVHVEEFKKELSREVMAMTCEVGRLQRERQVLEQQIADLFAFFAKQRAEMVSVPL